MASETAQQMQLAHEGQLNALHSWAGLQGNSSASQTNTLQAARPATPPHSHLNYWTKEEGTAIVSWLARAQRPATPQGAARSLPREAPAPRNLSALLSCTAPAPGLGLAPHSAALHSSLAYCTGRALSASPHPCLPARRLAAGAMSMPARAAPSPPAGRRQRLRWGRQPKGPFYT